jgi:hypothetical protein
MNICLYALGNKAGEQLTSYSVKLYNDQDLKGHSCGLIYSTTLAFNCWERNEVLTWLHSQSDNHVPSHLGADLLPCSGLLSVALLKQLLVRVAWHAFCPGPCVLISDSKPADKYKLIRYKTFYLELYPLFVLLDTDELSQHRGYGCWGASEQPTWYTEFAEDNQYVCALTWQHTLNLPVQKRCTLVKALQWFQSRRNLFLDNWSHDETILHIHQLLWIHQKLHKKFLL